MKTEIDIANLKGPKEAREIQKREEFSSVTFTKESHEDLPLGGKEDAAEIRGFEFIGTLILNLGAIFTENYRNKVINFNKVERIVQRVRQRQV